MFYRTLVDYLVMVVFSTGAPEMMTMVMKMMVIYVVMLMVFVIHYGNGDDEW